MHILLFLLFLAVPVAEIALFIQAGKLIGLIPTILLTIGTAVAGSVLMRVQGFTALNRFAQSLEKAEMPLNPVIDGISILAAGMLLITPGFLTDTLGLLLFAPPFRHWLARWIVARALASGRVRMRGFGAPGGGGGGSRPGPRPGPAPRGGGTGFKRSGDVVDAEFETLEPEPGKDDKPGASASEPAKAGRKLGNSPWRKG